MSQPTPRLARQVLPALFASGVFVLAGCVTTPPTATDVPYETIDEGSYSQGPGEADARAITDQETWASFWQEHEGRKGGGLEETDATPPEVDFATEFVVFAYAGQKSTGGHAVEVRNVTLLADVYIVKVIELAPGEGCMTTQALTYPYQVVKVERGQDDGDSLDVTFDRETETYACP